MSEALERFVLEEIQEQSKWIPPFEKGKQLASPWIHVNNYLPPLRRYVVVHYVGSNLHDHDQFGVNCSVMCRRETQVFGNDLVPWRWEAFGPGDYFAQEVDYWMAIPR